MLDHLSDQTIARLDDIPPYMDQLPIDGGYLVRNGDGIVFEMRTIRDDPLGDMHANGDITDAQFQAGRRWQAEFERLYVVPEFSHSYPVQRVKEFEAFLARTVHAVGDMHLLVLYVLGVGKPLRDVVKFELNERYCRGWDRLFAAHLVCLSRMQCN